MTLILIFVHDVCYYSHNVQLLVQSATGGIWRYPLHFKATEPEPDDTITIEAVGLDKQSSVGFRLSSHARWICYAKHTYVFVNMPKASLNVLLFILFFLFVLQDNVL